MKLRMALLALLAEACGFNSPGMSNDGGGGGDDVPPPDARACFGAFAMVCFETSADVPAVMKNFTTGANLDTDSLAQEDCDQHNDRKLDFCVVAGKGLVLPASQTIRAHGTKPLIVLSTDTMVLEALSTVDVSSNHTGGLLARGAGSNSPSCVNGTMPMLAGGGYGGSFGAKGGDGERFSGASAPSGTAAPALDPPPSVLRGGCPGGTGDADGGAGGPGGGAIAFIAATSIQVDGTVNASGAGGSGGPAATSGGGGGGSGGMIVIDSPSVTVTGVLFANGGGGGQGGSPVAGAPGGESAGPMMAGLGGNALGGRKGGFGGLGSFGPDRPIGLPAGGGAVMGGGGGGGGGAVGFIRVHGLAAVSTIFPTPIDLP